MTAGNSRERVSATMLIEVSSQGLKLYESSAFERRDAVLPFDS